MIRVWNGKWIPCASWALYMDAMRLVPGDNAREHWARKASRLKLQREMSRIKTAAAIGGNKISSATITITRIGKRKMDSDNLASSAKGVRDGIADALGIDDGDERLTWVYAQRTEKRYGVSVLIEVSE